MKKKNKVHLQNDEEKLFFTKIKDHLLYYIHLQMRRKKNEIENWLNDFENVIKSVKRRKIVIWHCNINKNVFNEQSYHKTSFQSNLFLVLMGFREIDLKN